MLVIRQKQQAKKLDAFRKLGALPISAFQCLNKFYIFHFIQFGLLMHPVRFATKKQDYSEFEDKDDPSEPNSKNIAGFSESDIEQMYEAQTNFHVFANQIGQLKDTMLRNDVIDHCDRTKINLNHLTLDSISRMIKNRIEKMIKNKRIKKNWSGEDVKILAWIVSKYSDFKTLVNIEKDLDVEDWKYISFLIPGVFPDFCMFKWLSLKKNNLTEYGWSQRESILLQKTVKKFGEKDWGLISQKLYFLNSNPNKIYRCAKQCREHWNCYLNPNLKKGPWTKEEDLQLLNIIKKNNCQKRWAQMVGEFRGRTENALKNRFTLIIEKEMKLNQKNKLTEMELIQQYLEKSYVQQFVENTPKKDAQSDERMKTRRRENLQTQTSISNSPSKIEYTGDKLKENIFREGFDKTKPNVIFSEELGNVENVEVVTLKSDEIGNLTEKILLQKSEYVPCTFDNNKLKRIFKL